MLLFFLGGGVFLVYDFLGFDNISMVYYAPKPYSNYSGAYIAGNLKHLTLAPEIPTR